ncbi:MAG: hypothetical protein V2A34_05110, partial [Lentisphaerota bacterium]
QPEEEMDLLVSNPSVAEHIVAEEMIWGSPELRRISRAIVGVCGWHSERIGSATLELAPELVRFAHPDILKVASRALGEGPVARILCLPDLPASRPLRKAALDALRSKGIDGVVLFRTILCELSSWIDVQKTYEKSDLLQMLRILKNYDMLKDAQMELSYKKHRKLQES